MNKFGRIILSMVLSVSMVSTSVFAAPKSSEIKKEKEAAQQKASQLEQQKNSAAGQVTALEEELSKKILEITNLEDDITDKQAEVDELTGAYNDAQAHEQQQYQDMKLRICYMYEEGDTSFLNKLVASESITDLLNQADYVQNVHSYDRQKLNEYVETKEAVAELKTSVEDEVKTLQKSQEKCETAKKDLEATIEVKQAEVENFAEQLENAQALAAQKAEEQKQAEREEAAAAAAAAEAAAQEAAEKAAAEQSNKSDSNSGNSSSNSSSSSNGNSNSGSGNSGSGSSGSSNSKPSSSSGSSSSSKPSSSSSSSGNNSGSSSGSSSSSKPSSSGSSSSSKPSSSSSSSSDKGDSGSSASSSNASKGQQIANYACQFIGNPYVWGGSSLTNGTDCSGFVMSVMAHFGISVPHSSYSQRFVGKKVSSLSEALPGDIICFNGHVAIYCGGNMIVHASNPRYGIVKTTISWCGKSVVAIRRVF